jgi:lysophospholipase L1-like esterase
MASEYMHSRKKRKPSRNTLNKDTRPLLRKTPRKKQSKPNPKTNPKKKMDAIEILLLGSSIIHQWTPILPDAPIPLHITNLGVDGLTTPQMGSNLETILQPLSETYKPSVILFYCGSNDISHPQTPQVETETQEIIENTEQIMEILQDRFPETLVVYLSILKCPGRSKFFAQIEKVNHSVRNFSKKARSGKKGPSRIQFVDLNPEIRANPDFFLPGGVHLNNMGYQIFNKTISKQIF